ncbi:hypothetical protein J3B02_003737 [Coemansia erecta]|nr:hypothetical protein J3B02_003737 [Coemansia erecta]
MALVQFLRKAMVCFYFALLFQLIQLCTPAQSLTKVTLYDRSATKTLDPLNRRNPVAIDIDVNMPAFLITMPFAVTSGPSSVSGTVTIYFQASRSVKMMGDFGQKFLARISTTTFLFEFEYQSSSSSNLPGLSRLNISKDILYLHRVQAQVQAESISFIPVD